jgi:hypothetical protein
MKFTRRHIVALVLLVLLAAGVLLWLLIQPPPPGPTIAVDDSAISVPEPPEPDPAPQPEPVVPLPEDEPQPADVPEPEPPALTPWYREVPESERALVVLDFEVPAFGVAGEHTYALATGDAKFPTHEPTRPAAFHVAVWNQASFHHGRNSVRVRQSTNYWRGEVQDDGSTLFSGVASIHYRNLHLDNGTRADAVGVEITAFLVPIDAAGKPIAGQLVVAVGRAIITARDALADGRVRVPANRLASRAYIEVDADAEGQQVTIPWLWFPGHPEAGHVDKSRAADARREINSELGLTDARLLEPCRYVYEPSFLLDRTGQARVHLPAPEFAPGGAAQVGSGPDAATVFAFPQSRLHVTGPHDTWYFTPLDELTVRYDRSLNALLPQPLFRGAESLPAAFEWGDVEVTAMAGSVRQFATARRDEERDVWVWRLHPHTGRAVDVLSLEGTQVRYRAAGPWLGRSESDLLEYHPTRAPVIVLQAAAAPWTVVVEAAGGRPGLLYPVRLLQIPGVSESRIHLLESGVELELTGVGAPSGGWDTPPGNVLPWQARSLLSHIGAEHFGGARFELAPAELPGAGPAVEVSVDETLRRVRLRVDLDRFVVRVVYADRDLPELPLADFLDQTNGAERFVNALAGDAR